MFNTVSMTGSGMAILIIMTIAQFLGISFDQNQVAMIVKDVIDIAGFVFMVWGQLRRNDLVMGLFRKFNITASGITTVIQ
jgi:hypothetical protein